MQVMCEFIRGIKREMNFLAVEVCYSCLSTIISWLLVLMVYSTTTQESGM
jgi:hypothetical protein